jgi:hypothetical protein
LRGATYTNPPRGSAIQRKLTYFRDHASPNGCLPLPHSPTPRPPIRRIARPPTTQLSSRFYSRATHAHKLLPAALAFVPFGCVLVRVRVPRDLLVMSPPCISRMACRVKRANAAKRGRHVFFSSSHLGEMAVEEPAVKRMLILAHLRATHKRCLSML